MIFSFIKKLVSNKKTLALFFVSVFVFVCITTFHTANAATTVVESQECGITDFICGITKAIRWITIIPSAYILGVSGKLFDKVFELSVTKLSTTLGANGGSATGVYLIIKEVWGVFRDIINMMFIFVLLYSAITTILQISKESWKKTVASVIVAALLINFSLFFTKVMIDSSNYFAVTIYNQIKTGTNTSSISGAIAQKLQLAELMTSVENLGKGDAYGKIILVCIIASIFMLTLAVVLFIVALLFIVRIVAFIILMIMSPIGIGGNVLPKLKATVGGDWWHDLSDQCFFAPIFMFFLLIVVKLLSKLSDMTTIGANHYTLTQILFASQADSVATVVSTLLGAYVFTYIVVIILLLKALEISKKMSKSGAEGVQNFALKTSPAIAKWTGKKFVAAPAKYVATRQLQSTANSFVNSRLGKWVGSSTGGIGGGIYNSIKKQGDKEVARNEVKQKNIEARLDLKTSMATAENEKKLAAAQNTSADVGILLAEQKLEERKDADEALNGVGGVGGAKQAMEAAGYKDIDEAKEKKEELVEAIRLLDIEMKAATKEQQRAERALKEQRQKKNGGRFGGYDNAIDQAADATLSGAVTAREAAVSAIQTRAGGMGEKTRELQDLNAVMSTFNKATSALAKIDGDLGKLYTGYNAGSKESFENSKNAIAELAKTTKDELRKKANGKDGEEKTKAVEILTKLSDASRPGATAAEVEAFRKLQKSYTNAVTTLQTTIKNQQILGMQADAANLVNGPIARSSSARRAVAEKLRQKIRGTTPPAK